MKPEDQVTLTAQAQDFLLVLGAAKNYERSHRNVRMDALKEAIKRVEEALYRTAAIEAALEE